MKRQKTENVPPPPVDSEWDTETKDYKCKSTHFDSIEDMKKTMEAEEDLPDDKEKVFVRISENEDGAMESVIIGPVEKVMTALEAVFAEQLNSIFTDDTPDIFKKLMLTAAMESLRKKVFDVFESKKNK